MSRTGANWNAGERAAPVREGSCGLGASVARPNRLRVGRGFTHPERGAER